MVQVKTDIKNDLMNRREVEVLFESDKTPSFVESSKIISDQFKANEENIFVEGIYGSFGKREFLIKASIYDTKELKEAAQKRATKVKKGATPAA